MSAIFVIIAILVLLFLLPDTDPVEYPPREDEEMERKRAQKKKIDELYPGRDNE